MYFRHIFVTICFTFFSTYIVKKIIYVTAVSTLINKDERFVIEQAFIVEGRGP